MVDVLSHSLAARILRAHAESPASSRPTTRERDGSPLPSAARTRPARSKSSDWMASQKRSTPSTQDRSRRPFPATRTSWADGNGGVRGDGPRRRAAGEGRCRDRAPHERQRRVSDCCLPESPSAISDPFTRLTWVTRGSGVDRRWPAWGRAAGTDPPHQPLASARSSAPESFNLQPVSRLVLPHRSIHVDLPSARSDRSCAPSAAQHQARRRPTSSGTRTSCDTAGTRRPDRAARARLRQ